VIGAIKIAGILFPLITTACAELKTQQEAFLKLLFTGEFEKARAQLKAAPYLKSAKDDWYRKTPLHIAVEKSQVELVDLLLDLKSDVNARDTFRFTPLHLVNDPEIAKQLIKHNADLEGNSFGGTPLENMALESSFADPALAKKLRAIAKILIEAGAVYSITAATDLGDAIRVKEILKQDPKQSRDENLLPKAVRNGYTEIVKLLLEYNPQAVTKEISASLLYSALENPEIVRLLIKSGADPKGCAEETIVKEIWAREKMSLLHHAARRGLIQVANLLIDSGADVNGHDSRFERTPLEYAVASGQLEMVKLLVKNKASVKDDDGLQALEAAFRGLSKSTLANRRSIITVLGESGVPLNLHAVVVLGDVGRVRKLLKDQPALASSIFASTTPLYWAVDLNQLEMVTILLDGGVPIDGIGEVGLSGLHLTTFTDNAAIAKMLIDRKADVNVQNDWGVTPLHYAITNKASKVTKLLLEAKAKVNTHNKYGVTPLHSATELNDPAVTKLLIDAKADVHAKDIRGRTPLHGVMYRGSIDVIKLLLVAGADLNAKDDEGRTPLSMADPSNKQLIDLLKKYGGK
jgi:ankyrin repeat protein